VKQKSSDIAAFFSSQKTQDSVYLVDS